MRQAANEPMIDITQLRYDKFTRLIFIHSIHSSGETVTWLHVSTASRLAVTSLGLATAFERGKTEVCYDIKLLTKKALNNQKINGIIGFRSKTEFLANLIHVELRNIITFIAYCGLVEYHIIMVITH